MLIGISGKIGSGKDTAAELFQELYPGANFEIKKFAGKLKQIATMLTGIPTEKFEEQEFKQTYLGKEWSKFTTSGEFGDIVTEEKMTVRDLLQKLGTEAMRVGLHENVWVNATMADYNVEKNWIITDVRFPNEAWAVKQKGILIRINRDNLPVSSNHPSETSLDNFSHFDFVIDNNGSIEDLRKKLSALTLKN